MNLNPYKKNPGYLIELDGLRCVAVSLVMVGHFTTDTHLEKFTWSFGTMGVTLFFVLSGFLIGKILMVEKTKMTSLSGSLKTFYMRRVLRIFPLYYLVLLIAFVANIPSARPYFGWLITYTANYPVAATNGDLMYVNHFWTLCVEEQFYVFFPLFVFLTPQKNLMKGFIALSLMAILCRLLIVFFVYHAVSAIWYSYVLTPCCFDCFGLGAILAFYFLYDRKRLENILNQKVILAILVLVTGYIYYHARFTSNRSIINVFGRLLFSIFSFWIIGKAALYQFEGVVRNFLTNKLIVYLGKISYGLYVYHFFVPYIMRGFHFPHQRVTYFLITILIAMISWHFFEYPINKLKKYFEYKERIRPPLHMNANH